MNPVVSIVLPAYNHAAFVRNAVQSVLDQTMQDFEIIAIDDCSSDQTAQIIEGIDDPRLTLIRHQSNHGAARTINEGVGVARAPFIAVLNSDDVFRPERLEVCLQTIRETGCMLLGTDLELIDEQSRVKERRDFWWNEWHSGLKESFRDSGDLAATMISGNIFVSTSNFFFDRRVFEIAGPLSDYRYVQDYEFLLRCLSLIPGHVTWKNEVLLQYRLHASNTILEDPVAPAFQTIEILARLAPRLISEANSAQRQACFEEHLLRLAGYIERGTAKKNEDARRTEVARLQACIDGLNGHVENLQRHCDGMQRHCDSLQAGNEALQRNRDDLRQRNESLQSHCDKLQAHCDELQAYCKAIELSNEKLEQFNNELFARNGELQAHCDNLQAHGEILQKHGEDLQMSYDSLKRYADNLQMSHDNLKRYADNLATQNEELHAYCDNLEKHCESLQWVCDGQANSLEMLQGKIDSAHQDKKELASQLDIAWLRCAELEADLNDVTCCLRRVRESRGYKIYFGVIGVMRYLVRLR